ncbi:hypothetical protein D9M70_588930 [compost metagenome]
MLPRIMNEIERLFQSVSFTEKRSFRVLPRAVSVPSTAAESGPVCVTLVERKVTVRYVALSKTALDFRKSSTRLSPVSTLSG